ncbi:hypothetical protein [Sciscionella marina]|uniref:hypothetical protein n=1 Tax=Sciscionella marina TaxID=508770 RepID=UPI000375A69A|nr:hypothetical protein [Sciscionella marina]
MTVVQRGGSGEPEAGRARSVGRDIHELYPNLYFAPLDAVAAFSAAEIADMVLRDGMSAADAGPRRDSGPASGQFAVSPDPPQRFDPELSMREPLELQLRTDGSLAVEIEFAGQDIRADPGAGEPTRAVLARWANARGWRLLEVVNDRGRSLPDVWNATFQLPDPARTMAEVVAFARRAIAVAEAHRYDGQFVDRLLDLLHSGDADGLVGTPVTAVFQPRPPLSDSGDDFRLALDVCAFGNSVHGGLVVFGLSEKHGRVAAVESAPTDGCRSVVERALDRLVYPPLEGTRVETVPCGTGTGLLLVHVPPQAAVLKPFLVRGAVIDGRFHQESITLVERREATVYVQSPAALHSQIAAGRALLDRDSDTDGPR